MLASPPGFPDPGIGLETWTIDTCGDCGRRLICNKRKIYSGGKEAAQKGERDRGGMTGNRPFVKPSAPQQVSQEPFSSPGDPLSVPSLLLLSSSLNFLDPHALMKIRWGVVKKALREGEGGRVGSGPAGPWARPRRHDAVEGRLDGLALGTKEKKVGKLGKNTAKHKLCRNPDKKNRRKRR